MIEEKKSCRGRKNKIIENSREDIYIKPFHIVCIGGSAGSMEALEVFFSRIPERNGLAFVLAIHNLPGQEEVMLKAVECHTKMNVLEVKDGLKAMANTVYIIPAEQYITIKKGFFKSVERPSQTGMIDFFLAHLSEDEEERAICIILSGMGTDGTAGVKAIKDKFGMVMAQNCESAQYDTMPASVIDTGLVDYIASPEALPEKLMAYVKYYSQTIEGISSGEGEHMSAFQKIFRLINSQTGHDFSFYKKNTICRRIERRMKLNQIGTITDYIRYIQENSHEIDFLFKELLIGVTNFFRDDEAFRLLREEAVETLLEKKGKGDIIRVWVPGCATGEEAYSIAMVFLESLNESGEKDIPRIQIFATDIDKFSIDKARLGLYPLSINAHVSPERLTRFFIQENNAYKIRKELREMIIFAPQNVIMDPPFTKLDILSCRNLLIYLIPEIQKKLIPLFHYTLNKEGVLFLGSSETIGNFHDLFTPLDNRWKIFRKKDTSSVLTGIMNFSSSVITEEKDLYHHMEKTHKGIEIDIGDITRRILLEGYTPPAVIINEKGDILYINGKTGKYLEPSPGRANMNIIAMAREGLKFELSSALHKAVIRQREIFLPSLKVRTNGNFHPVNVTIKPLVNYEGMKGLFMVVFEDLVMAPKGFVKKKNKNDTEKKEISTVTELERELEYTKEHLQSTIEEMETSQEELKSTNEELQSTNEELTTSKEELQSLNEELVTVNSELQNKIDELSQTNSDMKNLLNSIEIATVFLDNNLCIKRFTPQATKIINLINSDIGRPVNHIVTNLEYTDLVKDVTDVLETMIFKEVQIESKDNHWYLLRIVPYRTLDNIINGTVLTFIDITGLKQLQEFQIESDRRLRMVIENMPVMIYAFDENHKVITWNKECERVTGYSAEEIKGSNIYRILCPDDGTGKSIIAEKNDADYHNWKWDITCRDGKVKTVSWTSIAKVCPVPGWHMWKIGLDVTAVRPSSPTKESETYE
ncbi:MAG: CheR family methyltransferase [Candidatus Eremiobacterota bacterium]